MAPKGVTMEKQLTARKRQALEMRSRIQNVALDLFDRDGFENVSVEQIAQAAGCSVGNRWVSLGFTSSLGVLSRVVISTVT